MAAFRANSDGAALVDAVREFAAHVDTAGLGVKEQKVLGRGSLRQETRRCTGICKECRRSRPILALHPVDQGNSRASWPGPVHG